jgi:ribosomal RNA-processing protein 8
LQEKFANKLDGGRFRFLNEQLYTSTRQASFAKFQADSELFDVQYPGYREQVQSWPDNPLDKIVEWIRSRESMEVVADMG